MKSKTLEKHTEEILNYYRNNLKIKIGLDDNKTKSGRKTYLIKVASKTVRYSKKSDRDSDVLKLKTLIDGVFPKV